MMPQRSPVADKGKMLLEMVMLYKRRKIEGHHFTMPKEIGIQIYRMISKATNTTKRGN